MLCISPDGSSFIPSFRIIIFDSESFTPIVNFGFNSPTHSYDSQNEDYLYYSGSNKISRLDLANGDSEVIYSGFRANQIFDMGDQLTVLNNALFGVNDCGFITVIDK